MCGIFGVIDNENNCWLEPDNLVGVLDKLSYRGPNHKGWLTWNSKKKSLKNEATANRNVRLFLGHQRLSIIDLSAAAHQPMSSSDGRYHIIFNGEIYNYRELREELGAQGYYFETQSDTEVLLAACIHWGDEVVTKLTGMFAFALFDSYNETLFMARDHFGIKPLFYSFWNGGFAFSSEIPPLLDLPEIDREVNPQKLYYYLQFGLTDNDSQTLLRDVQQLPAAHYFKLNINDLEHRTLERYWQPDISRRSNLGFQDAVTKLRNLFLESVNLHLRSDVPVGAALSGGIDSSAIVCAIRYLRPETELHTFTYVADDQDLSEEKWADIVIDHVGAISHKVTAKSSELVSDLNHLIRVQGEPFGSTSIYAQHRIFRLAKEAGIKVMLDGQGADELFAGYAGYAGARLASLIWQVRCISAYRFLKEASAWPDRDRVMIIKRALNYFIPAWLQPFARKLVGRELVSDWMNADWFKERDVKMFLADWKKYGRNCLREELLRSLQCTSVPSLLRYEDRNSMAHSIESRVPFLNHKLVEFVYSLPEEYLIDTQGSSKSIFRQAMRGIVPDAILDRRDKIGFATPEQKWLRLLSPWVNQTLSEAAGSSVLRCSELQKEWRSVMEGKSPFGWHIWRWLNFLRWSEEFDVKA